MAIEKKNDEICFDTIRKGLTDRTDDCLKLKDESLASFKNIGQKIPYFSKGLGKEKILSTYFQKEEFENSTKDDIRSIVINDFKMSYCPKSLLKGRK